MFHQQQDIKFSKNERVELELTPLARQWLYDDAALKNQAEASARAYLKWLDGLTSAQRVELRREAQGEFHLIPCKVFANTMTKVTVIVLEDTRLPGGARFECGEPVVVSKNIDILIAGARRLAPVE